jgi:hypothetical protein
MEVVVSFTPQPLYSREKRGLDPMAGLDAVTKTRISLPLPGIKPPSSSS